MAMCENITIEKAVKVEGKGLLNLKELYKLYEETKSTLDKADKYITELREENEDLRKQVAELETELRVKEDLFAIKGAISEGKPSAEWYENRYQSDCITINQLHTTIDVLTDKLARLRGQIGL